MIVSSGEPESPSAISTFVRPGDDLRFAIFHGVSHRRVPFVRAILAIHGACRRDGTQNGRDSFYVFGKADVKVPFVMRRERFHSLCSGMFGQRFEFRVPGRVHRPVYLERSANPLEEFSLTLFFCRFCRVMKANQPGAFFH